MNYIEMSNHHVQQVALLENACFSSPWSLNAITSELDNPLALWLVAVQGDELVGYIGSQTVMDETDVMNIAVDPRYRRKGIAEGLICSLIEYLKNRGVHSLTLEVRCSNQPAISLYEKLGFAVVGRRPHYYSNPREDALIYRKEWEV